ncbi:hypothetical protein KKG46_04435, partial [Patescibacteria group bacterium]|nr:hypothetical protein [Patescibacteria group bacterium]
MDDENHDLIFLGQLVEFVKRATDHHGKEKLMCCELYHMLIGSTPREGRDYFLDLEGEFSFLQFAENFLDQHS